MATFKLEANPTFKAKVLIPVPGEKVAEVEVHLQAPHTKGI